MSTVKALRDENKRLRKVIAQIAMFSHKAIIRETRIKKRLSRTSGEKS